MDELKLLAEFGPFYTVLRTDVVCAGRYLWVNVLSMAFELDGDQPLERLLAGEGQFVLRLYTELTARKLLFLDPAPGYTPVMWSES